MVLFFPGNCLLYLHILWKMSFPPYSICTVFREGKFWNSMYGKNMWLETWRWVTVDTHSSVGLVSTPLLGSSPLRSGPLLPHSICVVSRRHSVLSCSVTRNPGHNGSVHELVTHSRWANWKVFRECGIHFRDDRGCWLLPFFLFYWRSNRENETSREKKEANVGRPRLGTQRTRCGSSGVGAPSWVPWNTLYPHYHFAF